MTIDTPEIPVPVSFQQPPDIYGQDRRIFDRIRIQQPDEQLVDRLFRVIKKQLDDVTPDVLVGQQPVIVDAPQGILPPPGKRASAQSIITGQEDKSPRVALDHQEVLIEEASKLKAVINLIIMADPTLEASGDSVMAAGNIIRAAEHLTDPANLMLLGSPINLSGGELRVYIIRQNHSATECYLVSAADGSGLSISRLAHGDDETPIIHQPVAQSPNHHDAFLHVLHRIQPQSQQQPGFIPLELQAAVGLVADDIASVTSPVKPIITCETGYYHDGNNLFDNLAMDKLPDTELLILT